MELSEVRVGCVTVFACFTYVMTYLRTDLLTYVRTYLLTYLQVYKYLLT